MDIAFWTQQKSSVMKKYLHIIIISFTLFLLFTNSINSQSGWFQENSHTNKNLYSVQFIDTNTGYACGSGITIFKTSNGGTNWINIFNSGYDTTNLNSIYFINTSTGYAVGGGVFLGGVVMKTTNSGLNWQYQNSNTSNYLNSIFFLPQNSGLLGFAAGNNGVLIKTSNGGTNWYLLTSGTFLDLLSIFFLDSSSGFTVGIAYRCLLTTNGGMDWINFPTQPIPPQSQDFRSVIFFNSNTGYIWVTGGYGSNNPYCMYKTTNSGNNWILQQPGGGIAMSFVDVNNGYTVGGLGYIYKTTNGGTNWFRQTSGTTKNLRSVYFADANTGWAVGDSGIILKTTNGGGPIGIRPISTQVPDQFYLFQNYPNPFNPSTKLKFSIPLSRGVPEGRGVSVRITIFDILGHEISTLVNERLLPGTYEVEWSASDHPSGLYFYRLESNNFVETKKMILLK